MNNPDPTHPPSTIYEKRLSGRVKHTLYEVNLERKTAFCTACGYTEIHVAKPRTREKPKVFCIKQFHRLQADEKRKRLWNPNRKPRHLLSEIDTEKLTATCSFCGPVRIWRRIQAQSIAYSCANKERGYQRNYHRKHPVSRVLNPRAHVLSEIDEDNKIAVCSLCGPVPIYIWQGKRSILWRCSNASVARIPQAQKIRRKINTDLINRYKVDHGCERCGYDHDPDRLYLHTKNPEEKEPEIEKLLKLSMQDLVQELDACKVLCENCYPISRPEHS